MWYWNESCCPGSRTVPDAWVSQQNPAWWLSPASLRRRQHNGIPVALFLKSDSYWRMERRGERRKWDSRRAAQLGRGRTGGGVADWRQAGREKKGGWGFHVRSEWRINPPCRHTPERARLKQAANGSQWPGCVFQASSGAEEFQEVSDLLLQRTTFEIFSPVPCETCQCYHLADGEMMARSLVFGFSFCLLSSEKCPPAVWRSQQQILRCCLALLRAKRRMLRAQTLDTKYVKDKIIGQDGSKCNNDNLHLNFLLLM